MQETFRDGTEVLGQIVDAKSLAEEVQESIDDPEVVKTTIHKEGSIITLTSGRKYRIQRDGSFRRYPPKQKKRGRGKGGQGMKRCSHGDTKCTGGEVRLGLGQDLQNLQEK